MESIPVAGTRIDAGAAVREIRTVGTARRADLIEFLWHRVARGIFTHSLTHYTEYKEQLGCCSLWLTLFHYIFLFLRHTL